LDFFKRTAGLWRERATPSEVFHYTTLEGFLGIIRSRHIHASQIAYLNDAAEMSYGRDLLAQVIKAQGYLEKGYRDNDATTLVSLLGKYAERARTAEIFTFSLCANDNLLSQWRAYADRGAGIAIGFQTENLATSIRPATSFHPALYEPQMQRELIHCMIEAFAAQFHVSKNKHDPQKLLARLVMNLHSGLEFFFPTLKHPDFNEEREWRLIHARWGDEEESKRNFKVGNFLLVPYIELRMMDNSLNLPISRVVVGPAPHQDLLRKSVSAVLTDHGYADIKVDCSSTPFRR
jgi:hypothetical protein